MYSDIYNTTVNVNGHRVFSSTYMPGFGCGCCGGGMFGFNSCFGFGFYNPAPFYAMGLGFMTGAALAPALPSIFKGIGQGFAWLGTKVIAPTAAGAWKGISSAASWVYRKGIKPAWDYTNEKVFKPIGKGVKKLWNNIFHKKSKASKTE